MLTATDDRSSHIKNSKNKKIILLVYMKIHSRSDSPDAINRIRCSAAERLQANDVSLITSFVSSPFADARTCL